MHLKASAAVTELALLSPNWPLPQGVHAVVSTRGGGVSEGCYRSANFGDHVGDNADFVAANRRRLAQQCALEHWQWLQQVHGVDILEVGSTPITSAVADGVTTRHKGIACTVLTADCLPILLCALDGSQVAAVHAGWRGLAAGIISQSVARFECAPRHLSAFLGPAIGPKHFEVGQDVYRAFLTWNVEPVLWRQLFVPQHGKAGHYLADLYGLARWALQKQGVQQIFGGNYCTFGEPQRFYSYRRDGVTGRMVSAIWLS